MQHQVEIKASPRLALLSAFTAAIAWSMTGPLVRLLAEFHWLQILFLRFLSAALIAFLFLICSAHLKKSWQRSVRSRLSWQLAVVMVVYYWVAVLAFIWAPVAEVSLLISVSPLLALMYRMITKQQSQPLELLACAVALLGVCIILAPQLQHWQLQKIRGDLFALLGAIIITFYAESFRRNVQQHIFVSSSAVTLQSGVLGIISSGVGILLLHHFTAAPMQWQALQQPNNISSAIALGVLSTWAPSVTYAYASKHLNLMLISATRLLTPVCASLLAMWLLHEIPPTSFWIGAVAVLLGLWLLAWSQS